MRSGKEAFCLANTDAVDYTVKNANWHPDNTDLSTACGQENSISVREVLDVGSGDTYTQDLPGPVLRHHRTCRTARTTSRCWPTRRTG